MADPIKPMSVNEVVELLANPKPLPIDRVLATLAEWHPLPARVLTLESECSTFRDSRNAANSLVKEVQTKFQKLQIELNKVVEELEWYQRSHPDTIRELERSHVTIRESRGRAKENSHKLDIAQELIKDRDAVIIALNAELDKVKPG